MKRNLLPCAVLLLSVSSCAPLVAFRPPSMPDPGEASLSLVDWRGDATAYFSAGTVDATELRITVNGGSLRVNTPQYCKANGAAILCTVPKLPAGGNFVLPMSGSNLNVVAVYKRASGAEYRLSARQ